MAETELAMTIQSELNETTSNDRNDTNQTSSDNSAINDGIRHRVRIFTLKGFDDAFNKELMGSNDNESDLEKILKGSAKDKIWPRCYRVFVFLLGFIASLLIITLSNVDFDFTKVFSIFLIGLFSTYFIHIYSYMYSAKNAYRIYSVNGIVSDDNSKLDWIRMPITSCAIQYRYEPINSISEFSAVGGGIANQLLIVISTGAWMVVLCIFFFDYWYQKTFYENLNAILCDSCSTNFPNVAGGPNGFSTIFELIGAFGLVLIGIFELDPYSPFLQNCHMLGVYLGFGCPVGAIAQTFWAKAGFIQYVSTTPGIISILLTVIAVVFFFIWTLVFNKKSNKYAEKIKKELPLTPEKEIEVQKEIKYLTQMNIISESITLYCASLTLCVWLWNFHDVSPIFNTKPAGINLGFSEAINEGPYAQYFFVMSLFFKCNTTKIQEYPLCT